MLLHHPFFTPWEDPVSHVRSFVLRQRIAPLQQSFYFCSPSVTRDESCLWFYAAFPPNTKKSLAVVSLTANEPFLRHYPAAGFTAVSPMVDGEGAYFCESDGVWWQPPAGVPERICKLDVSFTRGRPIFRVATHLTKSADAQFLALDGQVGPNWFLATVELATGTVRVLREFTEHFNHAQFSPVEPRRILLARDYWTSAESGKRIDFDHRLWLADTQEPWLKQVVPGVGKGGGPASTHEWWASDGLLCWVELGLGVCEAEAETGESRVVWPGSLCHAHCSSNRRWWCGDTTPYDWERRGCAVLFYDRATGRTTPIVSQLPPPCHPRGTYHIDPHPQFSPGDQWIVYTTTVFGDVDVALCPTSQFVNSSG
jgi:hypothetical protein